GRPSAPHPPSLPTRRSSDLNPETLSPVLPGYEKLLSPAGSAKKENGNPVSPPGKYSVSICQWQGAEDNPQGKDAPHGADSVLCQDRKSTRLNSSHVSSSYAV